MAKVQNKSMKGMELSLRYTRDEDGRPIKVKADAEGVFDLTGCNPKDIELLSSSKGWRRVAKAAASVVAPKPAPPAEEEESEEDGEAEGPDVAGLRSKKAAVALAAEWREKGYEIPELDPEGMKLGEMKDILTKALFTEGEEG